MLAFVGPCPTGREVNHISGVKTDGRLVNLEYVTHSENKLHAYRIGLQKPSMHTNWNPRHGENHRFSKLTLQQVDSVQEKLAAGMTQKEIAKEFGVNPCNISRIANGKRWIRSRTVLQ
jgi:DNA-binding NarL/FixJ family response regulator